MSECTATLYLFSHQVENTRQPCTSCCDFKFEHLSVIEWTLLSKPRDPSEFVEEDELSQDSPEILVYLISGVEQLVPQGRLSEVTLSYSSMIGYEEFYPGWRKLNEIYSVHLCSCLPHLLSLMHTQTAPDCSRLLQTGQVLSPQGCTVPSQCICLEYSLGFLF